MRTIRVFSIVIIVLILIFGSIFLQRISASQAHIDAARDDLTALLRANEIPFWFLHHANEQFALIKTVRRRLIIENAPTAIANYQSQERPNLSDPEMFEFASQRKMTIVIADQHISVTVTDLCDPDIRLIVAYDTTRYVLLGEDCGPLISLIQQFAAEREMNFQMDTTSLAAPGITRMKLPRTADRPN